MSSILNPEATLPAGFIPFTHDGVLLAYDPLTGCGVKWNTKQGGGRGGKAFQWNTITPSNTSRGRTQVKINGSHQQWHRIVAQHFLNGGRPIPTDLDIDHRKHVDGTAAQDILTNLRIVTKRENSQNLKTQGSSKYVGVGWHKARGKWRARAMNPLTGIEDHLGLFTNELEAAKAYIDYCQQHNLPHAPAAERLAAA